MRKTLSLTPAGSREVARRASYKLALAYGGIQLAIDAKHEMDESNRRPGIECGGIIDVGSDYHLTRVCYDEGEAT